MKLISSSLSIEPTTPNTVSAEDGAIESVLCVFYEFVNLVALLKS